MVTRRSVLQFEGQRAAKCCPWLAAGVIAINDEATLKIRRDLTGDIPHLVPLAIGKGEKEVLNGLGPHKCFPFHVFCETVESVHFLLHVVRSKAGLGQLSLCGAEFDAENARRDRYPQKHHSSVLTRRAPRARVAPVFLSGKELERHPFVS